MRSRPASCAHLLVGKTLPRLATTIVNGGDRPTGLSTHRPPARSLACVDVKVDRHKNRPPARSRACARLGTRAQRFASVRRRLVTRSAATAEVERNRRALKLVNRARIAATAAAALRQADHIGASCASFAIFAA